MMSEATLQIIKELNENSVKTLNGQDPYILLKILLHYQDNLHPVFSLYIKFTNDNHDNHDKGFMQLSCEEISLLMIAEANAISALAEKLPKS